MAIRSRLAKEKPKRNLVYRIIFLSLLIITVAFILIAFTLFRYILKPNVRTPGNEPASIIIRTGSTFDDVRKTLYNQGLIINRRSFEWVADRKNYPSNIKPGHYILKNAMSNNELVNMLRAGLQSPVKVVFNNIRKLEELAGKVSMQIEADSASLMQCWNDRDFLRSQDIKAGEVLMIFIPNTYELWWTTDAYEFTERMNKEFQKFWNEDRKLLAKKAGLSVKEVIILASIVEKETQKNDEKPIIAGVYMNRIRKNWPLQADPTVVYALGNFELKRVLTVHTKVESPYNTYLHTGLPPGPICIPSIASVEAVLKYKKHDYMFFCAKADLSGYHAFSRTLPEHNRYAKAYQKALNERNIR